MGRGRALAKLIGDGALPKRVDLRERGLVALRDALLKLRDTREVHPERVLCLLSSVEPHNVPDRRAGVAQTARGGVALCNQRE